MNYRWVDEEAPLIVDAIMKSPDPEPTVAGALAPVPLKTCNLGSDGPSTAAKAKIEAIKGLPPATHRIKCMLLRKGILDDI